MSSRSVRDRWVHALLGLGVLALVGFVAFCVVWRVQGGRWERVETPSMGSVAPVNSLLWVKPTDFETLRDGDFVTFHPPGGGETTYSHLVYRHFDDGTIGTKGVIPQPDPWHLTSDNVVGRVQMTWWGAGAAVQAAPVLIIGGLLVGALRSAARRRWKVPITLVLGSLVLSVSIVVYQPFIGAQQLSFAPEKSGGATASYIGTGLLPIRLTAHDGDGVVMRDGQVGSVAVGNVDEQGKLRVDLEPAIPLWWWVLLVLACFTPALYSLIIGVRWPNPLAVSSVVGEDR